MPDLVTRTVPDESVTPPVEPINHSTLSKPPLLTNAPVPVIDPRKY